MFFIYFFFYRQYVVEYRTEGSIRFLLCTHCPKRFKKPLDLVCHLRIHNSIMSYKVIVLLMIECRHSSSATLSFYSAQSVKNPSVSNPLWCRTWIHTMGPRLLSALSIKRNWPVRQALFYIKGEFQLNVGNEYLCYQYIEFTFGYVDSIMDSDPIAVSSVASSSGTIRLDNVTRHQSWD